MKKGIGPSNLKKLRILGEKHGAIRLMDLAIEMGLEAEEALVFLRQLFPVGSGLEIYNQDNDCWVDVHGEALHYMLPLSPGEWMRLHEVLSSTRILESKESYSLKRKVTENGPIKVVMELLSKLELWDEELNKNEQKIVHELEQSIGDKHLVMLSTKDDKSYNLLPCKIIHLEGQLSLIAEDSQDHCLLVIPLRDMQAVSSTETLKTSRVSAFEIEEFISAIRGMSEKETRLILKIHDPQSTNLFPDYHFLGKPCMITNPQGDLIWAAYVEAGEPLYEWLMSLGKKVEILDPVKFKEDYLSYCEEKLRKIA